MMLCDSVYLFRLMSGGVQSILLPSPRQGESPEFRGQAWGCATLSDVLLLVDVKYDVVTHLLYKEMLQEHYSKEKPSELSSQYNTEKSHKQFFFGGGNHSFKCLGENAVVSTTQGGGGAGGIGRGGFRVR